MNHTSDEMKARIRATGEIIEVKHGKAVGGNNVYLSDGVLYQPEELEPAEPDYTQVRIQAAIHAMSLVAGAYNLFSEEDKLIKHAVRIADALVKELKGD